MWIPHVTFVLHILQVKKVRITHAVSLHCPKLVCSQSTNRMNHSMGYFCIRPTPLFLKVRNENAEICEDHTVVGYVTVNIEHPAMNKLLFFSSR